MKSINKLDWNRLPYVSVTVTIQNSLHRGRNEISDDRLHSAQLMLALAEGTLG